MALNRYWKALVLISGDVWHSFEIDSSFYCPNENPLLRIPWWPFSLSCIPLTWVTLLYLKISIMSHVKRFEKGSRVWDASYLLPQAGREKRKALGLITLQMQTKASLNSFQATGITCPALWVSKQLRFQGCLMLPELSNSLSCEPH